MTRGQRLAQRRRLIAHSAYNHQRELARIAQWIRTRHQRTPTADRRSTQVALNL
jgi:hypothetical protein